MSRRAGVEEVPPCGCRSPGTADPTTCYCSVEDLLRIIRRRYSLAVMNVVHGQRPARYRDIARALPASSSTLADTLRALTAARLVVRGQEEGDPGGVHYVLSPSGEKLLGRLRRLLEDVQG